MRIQIVIEKVIEKLNSLKENKKNNWEVNSPYLRIKEMPNDDTGDVGELMFEKVFTEKGYDVKFDRSKTDDEKDWDIEVNNKTIEVKTATIGKSTDNFQHEKFFKNKNYDIIAFVDITATEVYLTMGLKENIVWENLHERADTPGEHKFDISLKNLKTKNISGRAGFKLKNAVVSKLTHDEDIIKVFEKVVKQMSDC